MDIRLVRKNNLKHLMDKAFGVGARGAQSRLADMLGKPQNFVSRCLADPSKPGAKTIGEDFAREIEASFGLERYALDTALPSDGMQAAGQEARNVEPAFQPSRKPKDYPLISWVTAGAWAEAPDNFHPGSADEWISSTENAGDHGFWLTVRGDSMTCNGNPTFPDGSLILVKPEADRISGKYYVVKLLDSGEQTFKQYVEDSGHKYLRPLNPSYRTMEINGNCHFIGRVIDTKMTGL